jgi:hypothetical protein
MKTIPTDQLPYWVIDKIDTASSYMGFSIANIREVKQHYVTYYVYFFNRNYPIEFWQGTNREGKPFVNMKVGEVNYSSNKRRTVR